MEPIEINTPGTCPHIYIWLAEYHPDNSFASCEYFNPLAFQNQVSNQSAGSCGDGSLFYSQNNVCPNSTGACLWPPSIPIPDVTQARYSVAVFSMYVDWAKVETIIVEGSSAPFAGVRPSGQGGAPAGRLAPVGYDNFEAGLPNLTSSVEQFLAPDVIDYERYYWARPEPTVPANQYLDNFFTSFWKSTGNEVTFRGSAICNDGSHQPWQSPVRQIVRRPSSSCGIGAELVVVLSLLASRRRGAIRNAARG
jgi:hypothetical protein